MMIKNLPVFLFLIGTLGLAEVPGQCEFHNCVGKIALPGSPCPDSAHQLYTLLQTVYSSYNPETEQNEVCGHCTPAVCSPANKVPYPQVSDASDPEAGDPKFNVAIAPGWAILVPAATEALYKLCIGQGKMVLPGSTQIFAGCYQLAVVVGCQGLKAICNALPAGTMKNDCLKLWALSIQPGAPCAAVP